MKPLILILLIQMVGSASYAIDRDWSISLKFFGEDRPDEELNFSRKGPTCLLSYNKKEIKKALTVCESLYEKHKLVLARPTTLPEGINLRLRNVEINVSVHNKKWSTLIKIRNFKLCDEKGACEKDVRPLQPLVNDLLSLRQ